MEVLRFGSSIPGGYWGCCAADIIQNCKVDPDAPASISLVDGDGGTFLQTFLGKTYREIFYSRLRIGTFSTRDMPNHAFFVILAKSQIQSGNGQKWMAILKECGFEFIRTVNNSVWNVDNYVFALFRNHGPNGKDDQFTPPQGWLDLPGNGKTEAWELIGDGLTWSPKKVTDEHKKVDQKVWDKIGPAKTYTQKELEEAGVPVALAAIRTPFPPQGPTARKAQIEKFEKGFGHKPDTNNVGTTGEIMNPVKVGLPETKQA